MTKRLLPAALAGAVLALALTSCARPVPPGRGTATGPTSYTVTGELLLSADLPEGLVKEGHECHGAKNYADVGIGAQVKVYDAEHRLLGTGPLQDGKYHYPDGCRMPFTVPLVPIGKGIYQVQIGSRDTRGLVSFQESSADRGTGIFPVSLTLDIN